MAEHLTRNSLRERVKILTGKVASETWVQHFLLRHRDAISVGKAHGLDPKRAKSFNPDTIGGHFDLLEKVMSRYNIQQRNCFNVDEKGLQLGGGHKNLPTQFIVSTSDCPCYALCSDSLVLVILIEAICVDGSAVPPVFILPKGTLSPWWDILKLVCKSLCILFLLTQAKVYLLAVLWHLRLAGPVLLFSNTNLNVFSLL